MSHKFALQQQVCLMRPLTADSRAGSRLTYEITRLLPADQSGEYSYRIRARETGERAVRESEIAGGGIAREFLQS